MHKFRQYLPFIALAIAVCIAWSAGQSLPKTPAESSSQTPSVYSVKSVFEDSEFKAVWVPYMSLDMSKEKEKHFGVFKQKFDAILSTVKQSGANTVLVHVHAFGDAMYRSSYYPWSHLLTGTQGQDPGYDPLAYMVEAAHREGLRIEAWINPLRLRSTQTPAVLSADNVRTRWTTDADTANDDWTVETEKGIYFNPAYEQVRTYIIDGVKELIAHYSVDGVHMDDYFYPTEDEAFDAKAYQAYCATVPQGQETVSLANWRTNNINLLVSGLYSAIKAYHPQLQFGISPQGNMSNCAAMNADIATWGSQEGYVDYLCPQLYYPFDSKVCPFVRTAEEWNTMITNPKVKLYGGLALYKAGDAEVDNGSWANTGDIIRQQLAALQEAGYKGFALYSYEYLTVAQTSREMDNVRACLGAVQSAPEPASASSGTASGGNGTSTGG